VKVKGKQPKAMNVAGWDELPWWQMDGRKVGAPAPRMEQSQPRSAKRPSRGWWGEQAGEGKPLPAMKQVEAEPSREAARVLRMPRGQKLAPSTWVLGAELVREQKQDALAALAAEENAAWLAGGEMPGWHGEWKAGLKKAGWREELRQQVALAQVSLGYAQGAEARVQELAQGHVRPVGMDGMNGLADEALADVVPSPLERMAAQEELAWLLKALSPRQREAVELKAEGLSRSEMAEAMGCSEERAKELLKDARKRARAAGVA
jgi:RNA polymerase sigma factor (sigma-70 family)